MQVARTFRTFGKTLAVAGVAAGVVVAGSGAASASTATQARPAAASKTAVTQAVVKTVKTARAAADCSSATAYTSVVYSARSAEGVTRPNLVNPTGVDISYYIKSGDTVTITVTARPGCEQTRFSAATYRAPVRTSGMTFDQFLRAQVLYSSATRTGSGSLTVKVPVVTGQDPTSSCTNKHLGSSQTYNGNGGPAPDNQYASTCDGSPSKNGSGAGAANGKPCAGCVGNADNKNPKGQAPNGGDPNAGYECDRNNGVGQTNPAHTGCATRNWQFDFAAGPVIPQLSQANDYNNISYATATPTF